MAFPIIPAVIGGAAAAGLFANRKAKKLPSFGDFEDPKTRRLRDATFDDVINRVGTFRDFPGGPDAFRPERPGILDIGEETLTGRLGGASTPGIGRADIGSRAEASLGGRLDNPFDASQVIDAPGAQRLFDLRRDALRSGFEDQKTELSEKLVGLGLSRSPAGIDIERKLGESQALQESLLAEEISNEQLNRFAGALDLQERSRGFDISTGFGAEGDQRRFDLDQFLGGEGIRGQDIDRTLGFGKEETRVSEGVIERIIDDFNRQFDEQRANLEDARLVQGDLERRQVRDFDSRVNQVSQAEKRRQARNAGFARALGSAGGSLLSSLPLIPGTNMPNLPAIPL